MNQPTDAQKRLAADEDAPWKQYRESGCKCQVEDAAGYPTIVLYEGDCPIVDHQIHAKLDALSDFKAYVHQRLDEAGIPTHLDGPHSKEGCRIGDRLDVLIGQRDANLEDILRLTFETSADSAKLAEAVRMAGEINQAKPEAVRWLMIGRLLDLLHPPATGEVGKSAEQDVGRGW